MSHDIDNGGPAEVLKPSEVIEAARTRARFMGLSHFQAAAMVGELLDAMDRRIEALERALSEGNEEGPTPHTD